MAKGSLLDARARGLTLGILAASLAGVCPPPTVLTPQAPLMAEAGAVAKPVSDALKKPARSKRRAVEQAPESSTEPTVPANEPPAEPEPVFAPAGRYEHTELVSAEPTHVEPCATVEA